MKPLKLSNVSSKFGAPMGRSNFLPSDATDRDGPIKLRMVRLRWVDGDYDQGGAYWGQANGDSDIYWASGYVHEGNPTEEELVEVFVRAKSREIAKQLVREILPKAKFYR